LQGCGTDVTGGKYTCSVAPLLCSEDCSLAAADSRLSVLLVGGIVTLCNHLRIYSNFTHNHNFARSSIYKISNTNLNTLP